MCTRCGTCTTLCPTGAVTMPEEEAARAYDRASVKYRGRSAAVIASLNFPENYGGAKRKRAAGDGGNGPAAAASAGDAHAHAGKTPQRKKKKRRKKARKATHDADGRELCLKWGVCSKVKGHSGAHKGVPSWNSPNYA
mgnify:CR=1 FL=1